MVASVFPGFKAPWMIAFRWAHESLSNPGTSKKVPSLLNYYCPSEGVSLGTNAVLGGVLCVNVRH